MAIAKAMGFPPEVCFEEGLSEGPSIGQAEQSRGVAGRPEHLFEILTNPSTGEPYTNAEVARMTFGDLTEEDACREHKDRRRQRPECGPDRGAGERVRC
jgi:hypothetical protein